MDKERIKQHFRDHKELYIGIAVGVGLGVITAVVVSNKVNVSAVIVGRDNTLNQITEINLVRRGHPGNVIKCVETGEMFASQRRTADVLGINRTDLGLHLKGLKDNINGLHYQLVGEAV